MRKCSSVKPRAQFATAAFSGALLAYKNEDFRQKVQNSILGQKIPNECDNSAEELAA